MRPRISASTTRALHKLSEPGESVDDTIRRLLETHPDVHVREDELVEA